MSRVARHLRSNLVGYVALFFATGLGTAWALQTNSVESRHIAKDQVKPKDIAEVKALQHTGDISVSDFNGDAVPTDHALGSARGFKFTGRCFDESGVGNTGTILVEAKDADAVWSLDSTAENGDDDATALTGADQPVLTRVGPLGNTHFEGGTWALREDSGSDIGPSLHGLVAVSLETSSDCTFSLTILG